MLFLKLSEFLAFYRRLWHQLTIVLMELVKRPEVTNQLKEIYENVIADFEMK